MSLVDDILTSLDSSQIEKISSQLGVDPSTFDDVLKDAIPTVLGGLNKNSQDEAGASSLASALTDHAGANPLGNIGELINGQLGQGILKHVLGGATGDVSNALGQKNGVGGAQAQQILAIVAPLVMSFLADRVTGGSGKADTATVQKEVQKEAKQAQPAGLDINSILGSIFGK